MKATEMKLASALAEISMKTTRRCKEDYLYELVAIAHTLEQGESYILTTRDTGADSITRFGEYRNLAEGITNAKQSLGVDCIFIFAPDEEYGFSISIINVNLDKHDMWALKNGLDCRGIHFTEIKVTDEESIDNK